MLFREKVPTITPRDAAEQYARRELQLVDVRGDAELAEIRIPGARHIPLNQVRQRAPELDRDRPVAFVCRSGRRSAMAARTAARAGVRALNVEGGVVAWEREGLPVAR
jgi:rhodanese-related sulfurtransferase